MIWSNMQLIKSSGNKINVEDETHEKIDDKVDKENLYNIDKLRIHGNK